MHPLPQPERSQRIAALLFLIVIGIGGLMFMARFVVREMSDPRTAPASVKFLLSGGASEIMGTKRAPSAWRASLEWELSENHPFKVFFLEAGNRYERLIRWNVPTLEPAGEPFNLTATYLGRTFYVRPNERQGLIRQVERAMEAIAVRGIPATYVVPPSRYSQRDVWFDGVFNFENDVQDAIVSNLTARGWDVLDLREKLESAGIDPHDAFFATDHHFTSETGLWTAQVLAGHLRERWRIPLNAEALDDSRFRSRIYRRLFLGSIGKRRTLARCEPDDIGMLGTTAPVDFELTIPDKKVHARGNSKSLIWWDCLRRGSLYRNNPYMAYLRSDNPLVTVRNHSCTNGVRLLLLSDSIDNVVVPHLACAASETVTIDLRHYRASLEAYLEGNRFDAVLLFWSFPEPATAKRIAVGRPDSRDR